MRRYIIDASVAVKWMNQDNEESSKQALSLLQGAVEGRYQLLSCDLLPYEIFNALIRGKKLKGPWIEKALDAFFLLPIETAPLDPTLAASTALIAEQSGMSYYDAAYVALAFQEQAPLLTANIRDQARMKNVTVINIADWYGEDTV